MNELIPLACLALFGTAGSHAVAGGQRDPAGALQQSRPPGNDAAGPDGAAARPAQDQQEPPRRARPDAAPGGRISQVNVSGSRANDTDLRRMSTASKMIFGREELDRNGDSSVGEILKRLPGATMGGAPGRGSGIRMRGLGKGYTQVLVNGERPPPGFSLESLESLAPEQVERIEVMRGPVAEHSTQAIAGTINIVLREGYQQKDTQVRVADSIEQGRHGASLSVTAPGKAGKLTWLLSVGLMQHRQHNESASHDLDTRADGSVVREQDIHSEGNGSSRGIHLSPRLSYRFDNGDTLNVQPFLVHNQSGSASDTSVDQLAGALPPAYALQQGASDAGQSALGPRWVSTPADYDSARVVAAGPLAQATATATRTYTTLGVRLETKM